MKFSVKQLALASLAIVAFGYAVLNVSIRLSNVGFQPLTQVYLRIFFGCLLAYIVFRKEIRFKTIKKTPMKDWLWLSLMGLVGYGLAVDFVTLGALHTKLLNVSIISSTAPFFVFLYSLFFYPKHTKKSTFVFLVISFIGVAIIATKSYLPTLTHFGQGELYVLLFAVFLGIYIIGRKKLSNHLNNKEITLLAMAIAFVGSFLTALILGEHLSLSSFLNPEAVLGIFLGSIFNVIATQLENFGYKNANSVVASQVLLLENLFSPLFGFFLYKETIIAPEIVGALLVILSVVAVNRMSSD